MGIMEREKLVLNLDTIIMAIPMDMAMDTTAIMERERLKPLLNLVIIIMDTVTMEDMVIMGIMERGKLNLVIIITVMVMDMVMVMAMDIMVEQKLFIDFYTFSRVDGIFFEI